MKFDGDKLRALRKSRRLSLKKTAETLQFITKREVCSESVRKWEVEGVSPRADVLIALSELFDLEPREFFIA